MQRSVLLSVVYSNQKGMNLAIIDFTHWNQYNTLIYKWMEYYIYIDMGGIYVKKFKWILVLAIILIVIQNYPSNVAYGKKIDNLKFKDIESLIMKNNPTIKINHNTKANLHDAIKDIGNAKLDKRKLENAIDGMDEGISGMNKAVSGQTMMINNLKGMLATPKPDKKEMTPFTSGPEDINSKFGEIDGKFQEVDGDLTKQNLVNSALYTTQIGTLESVKILYDANIESLRQNRDSMKKQLKEFDKLPIKEMELEKAILQIDMGNQSIIWGGQNLYLAYNSLKSKRDELGQNLQLLDNQINIMTLQEELGMITLLDLDGIKNQRQEIIFAIDSLQDQMDNLMGELNLILGEDFDRPLELEDSFKIDKNFIPKMNYKKDKQLAKNNSYSIKLKNYDYKIQYDNMLWENKNGSSDELRTAKRNADNAKLALDQEGKNVELIFSKAYQEIQSKVVELKNENNNLEYEQKKQYISQLKYELGMISKMEFEDAKSKYDSQNSKVKTIEQDLFQKSLQYKALLKGINFIQ